MDLIVYCVYCSKRSRNKLELVCNDARKLLYARSKVCNCETSVDSENLLAAAKVQPVSNENSSINIDPTADLIKIEQALQKAEKIRSASQNQGSKPQTVAQISSSAAVQNKQVLPNDKQQPAKTKPIAKIATNGVSVKSSTTISESQLRNVKSIATATRYVPAHMKAPFRTMPQYQKPKSARQSQGSNKPTGTQVVNVAKDTKSKQMTSSNIEEGNSVNAVGQSLVLLDNEEQPKLVTESRDIAAETLPLHKSKVESQQPVISNTQTSFQGENKTPAAEQPERKVKLPSRYKQLVKNNQQLRKKLTQPCAESSLQTAFIDRLAQTTELSLATDEVDKVKFMKTFTETLSSIQKCLGNEFSVLAGWSTQVEAARELAMLRILGAQLQHLQQQLAAFDVKPKSKDHTLRNTRQQVFKLSASQCSPHDADLLLEGATSQRCVSYRNRRQLEEHARLRHSVACNLLQLRLLHHFADYLHDFQDSKLSQLTAPAYRLLYGLLTANGTQFPTMIDDSSAGAD